MRAYNLMMQDYIKSYNLKSYRLIISLKNKKMISDLSSAPKSEPNLISALSWLKPPNVRATEEGCNTVLSSDDFSEDQTNNC